MGVGAGLTLPFVDREAPEEPLGAADGVGALLGVSPANLVWYDLPFQVNSFLPDLRAALKALPKDAIAGHASKS